MNAYHITPSIPVLPNCDFELEDLCGWGYAIELNSTEFFHFTRTKGTEHPDNTNPDKDPNGPQKDHNGNPEGKPYFFQFPVQLTSCGPLLCWAALGSIQSLSVHG